MLLLIMDRVHQHEAGEEGIHNLHIKSTFDVIGHEFL